MPLLMLGLSLGLAGCGSGGKGRGCLERLPLELKHRLLPRLEARNLLLR